MGTVRHALSNRITKKNTVTKIVPHRMLMFIIISTGRNQGSWVMPDEFFNGIVGIDLRSEIKWQNEIRRAVWCEYMYRSAHMIRKSSRFYFSLSTWREKEYLHMSVWLVLFVKPKSDFNTPSVSGDRSLFDVLFCSCSIDVLIMSMRGILRSSRHDALRLCIVEVFPEALDLRTNPMVLVVGIRWMMQRKYDIHVHRRMTSCITAISSMNSLDDDFPITQCRSSKYGWWRWWFGFTRLDNEIREKVLLN